MVSVTDRFTSLSRPITTSEKNVTTIALNVPTHWVGHCNILSKLQSDSGAQFVTKYFMVVCGTLWMIEITTIEYCPPKTDQNGRFNSAFVLRSCYYVSEQRAERDTYQLPLTDIYNVEEHRRKNLSPSSLAPTRALIGPPTAVPKCAGLSSDNNKAFPF